MKKFLNLMLVSYPIIIIEDFNIDMIDETSTQPNELQNFMDQYSMEFQFKKITTIYGSHIDHIWTNTLIQQCMLEIVEAYWTHRKPIYFAFKLIQLHLTIPSHK
jgi:hypothetical protein